MRPPSLYGPCTGCGACCSGFGGSGDDGLPLLPEEFRAYREHAGRLGRAFRSSPRRYRQDILTGQVLVSHYVIHTEPCVLLEGSECSIHAERPLACRAFPVHIASGGEPTVSRRCEAHLAFGALPSPELLAAQAMVAIAQERRAELERLEALGVIRLGPVAAGPDVDLDLFLARIRLQGVSGAAATGL